MSLPLPRLLVVFPNGRSEPDFPLFPEDVLELELDEPLLPLLPLLLLLLLALPDFPELQELLDDDVHSSIECKDVEESQLRELVVGDHSSIEDTPPELAFQTLILDFGESQLGDPQRCGILY